MRIMDENGRLFGKISIIDVVVLLLVAAIAASIAFVRSGQQVTGNGATEETITFQVLATGLAGYLEPAVQTGDKLFDKDYASGGALGTITDVEVLPGTKQAYLNDGTVAQVEMEEGVNLLLTVEGSGLVSASGSYSLNRIYDLGVNSARTYYTKYAEFTGTVTDIFSGAVAQD